MSKYVFLIWQSENPQFDIFAWVKSASSKLHLSNTELSRIDFWKFTFSKLHITNIVPVKSAFSKLQLLRSKFFLSLLLPPFSFWKIQFSATELLKLQFNIEEFEKSRKLSLLSENLHPEKPIELNRLSEKSQPANMQFAKFMNLKVRFINLQFVKVESSKSTPWTSLSVNSFFL
ncbi:MAG TPA: hypothetical protein VMR19_00425 [Candidatus Saccharimonadales bacterium]|nr:hypothetical protein [Candidatus Saccharimonadales bacterium]